MRVIDVGPRTAHQLTFVACAAAMLLCVAPYLALSIAGLASQAEERGVAGWVQILRQEIAAVLSGNPAA